MANKNLFLIHGAWASRQAFNYLIKKTLDEGNVGRIHCFEYDCQTEPIGSISVRAHAELRGVLSNGLETVVLGHSLGGLIALSLSQYSGVSKAITVASPLAGLKLPRFVQFFVSYHTPILKELVPTSEFMRYLHAKDYSHVPVECIVAAEGYNPMIYERNDGVVTYNSQTKWHPKGAKVTFSYTNHHEVLQSAEVLRAVEKELTRT
jgi:pimeloyl-ACP methyl ester carboxylesterase